MSPDQNAPAPDPQPDDPGHASGAAAPAAGRGRWPVRLAAFGGAFTAPVATWWLIGDQSADVAAATRLDYMVRPIDVAGPVQTGAGAGAALMVLAALAYLVWASRRGRFDRRWWATIAPVLVAGVIAGAGWRVITMGTVGANIGGALVILFGGGLTALLLLWAAIWSGWLLARGRRRPASR
jgi:hypothetical protein